MSGPTPAGFSYIPAPHERAYYGALFQAADSERSGSIGGANAVEFFTRSKLPIELLKHIWVAADQPPTNALNHIKFAVAIRLIQLEQNGVKPTGHDLAAVPGNLRPPFFEGIQPQTTHSPSASAAPSVTPPRANINTAVAPSRPPQQMAMAAAAPGGGGGGMMVPPARPPMQQQQRQQPAAPSGGASLSGLQQLAVQDPYSLTPQEQARYEQLFPDYAKDSQYMYGPEAVALFSKSGLPQTQLGLIWNMVDVPVDNRLDKLEFAMAMHLIVCVSKKNLPMPGALPLSMKQLKAQQRQQQQQLAQEPSPPSIIQAPREVVPQQQGGGMYPPSQAPQHNNQQQQNQQQQQARSSLPGPPPLPPQGGGELSISDAFEGLGGDTGSIASYNRTNHESSQQQHHYQPSYSLQQHIPPTVVETVEEDTPLSPTMKPETKQRVLMEPTTLPPPLSSSQLAASYDLGESTMELEKLRSALQKLQAENISLKARLGSMTEEEKDIHKELGATIAEIVKLSGELTSIRAQVLASKSRLLEASAELNTAKGKKGMIQDQISEAKATKQAMDEAYDGIEKANKASMALPAPMATQEADLFGWDELTPSAPAQAPRAMLQSNGFPQHPSSSHDEEEQESIQPSPAVSFAQPPSSSSGVKAPQMSDPPPQQRQAPVFTFNQSANTPGTYNGGGYHNRNASGGGFGEVMGGSADMQSLAESIDPLPSSPSMKEIDDLKSQLREAESVARDSEASHRQLVAQMAELRRLADEAESKSRSLAEKPAKKKGLLRTKAKSVDAKELERVTADARQKKDSLLEVQAQVKDAEALSSATRREAEKLRKQAEDAQVQVATAASMQYQAQSNPIPMKSAPVVAGPNGGRSLQPQNAYGGPQNPYFASPPVNTSKGYPEYGFGQQSAGFDSHVMSSGGGFSIPTPQNEELYGNPFTS